jgi:hypothetical protein
VQFQELPSPYPKWLGPYSPSRGRKAGFRVRGRRLGVWVGNECGASFWEASPSEGVQRLSSMVTETWGGGRVLLLASGVVVKPLPTESDIGRRVVVGYYSGAVRLQRADGGTFDFSEPGQLKAGDPWPGPSSTGLECILDVDGTLSCEWRHLSSYGWDIERRELRRCDPVLAHAFRAARPFDRAGRVRLTENGCVITKARDRNGDWECRFVAKIDPPALSEWRDWIV